MSDQAGHWLGQDKLHCYRSLVGKEKKFGRHWREIVASPWLLLSHLHGLHKRREVLGCQRAVWDQSWGRHWSKISFRMRSIGENLVVFNTWLLTMSANPDLSLCLPAVMMSHFWPALPSQGLVWIGVRFSRKSPDVGSTKRHCPLEVYCGIDFNIDVEGWTRELIDLDLRSSEGTSRGTVALLGFCGRGGVQFHSSYNRCAIDQKGAGK